MSTVQVLPALSTDQRSARSGTSVPPGPLRTRPENRRAARSRSGWGAAGGGGAGGGGAGPARAVANEAREQEGDESAFGLGARRERRHGRRMSDHTLDIRADLEVRTG